MNEDLEQTNKELRTTIGWGTLFVVSLVLLLTGPVSHVWHAQKKDRIWDEMAAALDTAIMKEKMLYCKQVFIKYDATQSPDGALISLDEKTNHMIQIYLSRQDPNRHCLDSLYDAELKQRGLTCVSAICYSLGDSLKGTSCSANELQTMELVKQYSFRVLAKKPPFVLQAYVQMSNLNAGGWHPYFFFSLGALGMLFSLYQFWKERRKWLAYRENVSETLTPWQRLSPSILYDEQYDMVRNEKYNSEQSLKGLSKELFNAFLKKPHYLVKYEEIAEMQGYSRKDLSDKDLNRIHKAIKPLREQLHSLGIEFRNIKKTGYQMIFPDEAN